MRTSWEMLGLERRVGSAKHVRSASAISPKFNLQNDPGRQRIFTQSLSDLPWTTHTGSDEAQMLSNRKVCVIITICRKHDESFQASERPSPRKE